MGVRGCVGAYGRTPLEGRLSMTAQEWGRVGGLVVGGIVGGVALGGAGALPGAALGAEAGRALADAVAPAEASSAAPVAPAAEEPATSALEPGWRNDAWSKRDATGRVTAVRFEEFGRWYEVPTP